MKGLTLCLCVYLSQGARWTPSNVETQVSFTPDGQSKVTLAPLTGPQEKGSWALAQARAVVVADLSPSCSPSPSQPGSSFIWSGGRKAPSESSLLNSSRMEEAGTFSFCLALSSM